MTDAGWQMGDNRCREETSHPGFPGASKWVAPSARHSGGQLSGPCCVALPCLISRRPSEFHFVKQRPIDADDAVTALPLDLVSKRVSDQRAWWACPGDVSGPRNPWSERDKRRPIQ